MKIWVVISRMRVVAWMSRVAVAIWRFVVLHYSKRRLGKDDKDHARSAKPLIASSPSGSLVPPLKLLGAAPALAKLDGDICGLIPRTAAPVATAPDAQVMTLTDYEATAGARLLHNWSKDSPVKYNDELLDKCNAVLAHTLSGKSLLAKAEGDTSSEAPTASTDTFSIADSDEMDDDSETESESEDKDEIDGDEADSPGSDTDEADADATTESVDMEQHFDASGDNGDAGSEEGDTQEGDDKSNDEVEPEAEASTEEPTVEPESDQRTIAEDESDATSDSGSSDKPKQLECFEEDQEASESSDKVVATPIAIDPEDTALGQRNMDVAKYICHFEACKPNQAVSSQSDVRMVHRAARWKCVGYGRYVKCSPEQHPDPKVFTMATRSVHWMRVGHSRYDKYFVDGNGTMTPACSTHIGEEGPCD